jgi:hypothetical protein
MKSVIKSRVLSGLFFLLGIVTFLAGQTKMSTNIVNFKVSGTSPMHDWDMNSSEAQCSAVFNLDAKNNISDITDMTLTVSSRALKSGKGLMDKKAYNALKAEQHPNITAKLLSADVINKDGRNYEVNSKIRLTIAGKSIDTDLKAQVVKNSETSFAVKGEKKINMLDYGMETPGFMGVRTGKDVVLSFNLTLVK